MAKDIFGFIERPDPHGDEDFIDECPICGRDFYGCKCGEQEVEEDGNPI